MATVADLVLVEQSGGIAEVTLNRPAKLNALSTGLLEALLDTLQAGQRGPLCQGRHSLRRGPGVLSGR